MTKRQMDNKMAKIVECFAVGDNTVLILSELRKVTDKAVINNIEYNTQIAYDIPNAISIAGNHDFSGDEIRFI